MAVAEHPKGVGHLGKYFFKSSDMPHPTTDCCPISITFCQGAPSS
jgi:hypothetical protein